MTSLEQNMNSVWHSRYVLLPQVMYTAEGALGRDLWTHLISRMFESVDTELYESVREFLGGKNWGTL